MRIEDPAVFEGQGTEVPVVVEEWGTETPTDLERQGVESPENPREQSIKIPVELSAQGTNIGEGIKTLNNEKTPSIETLSDVTKQDFNNLDLNDDETCFESVAKNTFTPEDLSATPSTLFLNSRIVDLEQQVHDVEALN